MTDCVYGDKLRFQEVIYVSVVIVRSSTFVVISAMYTVKLNNITPRQWCNTRNKNRNNKILHICRQDKMQSARKAHNHVGQGNIEFGRHLNEYIVNFTCGV